MSYRGYTEMSMRNVRVCCQGHAFPKVDMAVSCRARLAKGRAQAALAARRDETVDPLAS